MGGFYERLVGTTKMSLGKSIGRVSLTSSQLQRTLTKVETVINTGPLVYVDNNLQKPNHDTCTLFLHKYKDWYTSTDIKEWRWENWPQLSCWGDEHCRGVIGKLKKEQRHPEQFWELQKNHYLLNLGERSQLLNKHPRAQPIKEPRIRDIIQVKDSSPRETWRIGHVIEMIESQDEQEQAAKFMIPNKNILQRSFIHPYPLECNEEEQLNEIPSRINLKINRKGKELKNNELRTEMNQGDKAKHRPKRTAAV